MSPRHRNWSYARNEEVRDYIDPYLRQVTVVEASTNEFCADSAPSTQVPQGIKATRVKPRKGPHLASLWRARSRSTSWPQASCDMPGRKNA